MALTLNIKTLIIQTITATDTDIATALNDGMTYTHIYGFAVVTISNTQSRIIILYD